MSAITSSEPLYARLIGETAEAWKEFLLLTVAPATLAAAFLAVVFVVTRLARISLPQLSYTLITAFVMVGLVPGIVAGYSQQPIAGTFLTATVGIISALIAYGFAKDSLEAWRPVMPFLIIATLFGALVGFSSGGVSKYKWLRFDQQVAQRQAEIEKVFVPIEYERQNENLRRAIERNTDGYISRQEVIAANNGTTEAAE